MCRTSRRTLGPSFVLGFAILASAFAPTSQAWTYYSGFFNLGGDLWGTSSSVSQTYGDSLIITMVGVRATVSRSGGYWGQSEWIYQPVQVGQVPVAAVAIGFADCAAPGYWTIYGEHTFVFGYASLNFSSGDTMYIDNSDC